VFPGAARLFFFAAGTVVAQPGPPAAPAAETVLVEGLAAADGADRAASARQDAMRKAIEQVAGRQVRSLALTSYHQLVANYTLAQTSGFVEAAEPVGPPDEADGVYRQRYRITVKAGEVNRDLVAQKIDVDFLYEIVARPRIALAVHDEWRPPERSGGWEPDGRALSNQEIARYFKNRHQGFVFKDLDLLRETQEQTVDYVREAARSRFDILIVGRTRAVLRGATAAAEANAWLTRAGDAGGRGKRYAFDIEVEWRALNVATAETLFTVTGTYATPEGEGAAERQAPDAALVWAKRQALARKVPELFRELLAGWNRAAFDQSYEIVFRTDGRIDPEELRRGLTGAGGFEPETVRLVTAAGGEVVFGARSPQGGTDRATLLRAAFAPRFLVQEIRPGRIVLGLAPSGGGAGVRLEVGGLGFSDVARLQQQLERLPQVGGVQREEFAGGRAVWTLATAQTVEELALLLEGLAGMRLQVQSVGARRIEARLAEVRP
jgi:hypothetical protein